MGDLRVAVSLEWLDRSSDLAIHHHPFTSPPRAFAPLPSGMTSLLVIVSPHQHLLIVLSSPPPCGRATRVCPLVASHSSGSAPIPPLHAVKGELRHFFSRIFLGIKW